MQDGKTGAFYCFMVGRANSVFQKIKKIYSLNALGTTSQLSVLEIKT